MSRQSDEEWSRVEGTTVHTREVEAASHTHRERREETDDNTRQYRGLKYTGDPLYLLVRYSADQSEACRSEEKEMKEKRDRHEISEVTSA